MCVGYNYIAVLLLILRIACILHCADCCSRGIEPSEESVNHDTLLRSFNLAHYYRYQAIYGFSVNAPDGNIVKAEKIIQIFKTKEIKQGLKSDLYHACRCNLFPSAKDFYSALDISNCAERFRIQQYSHAGKKRNNLHFLAVIDSISCVSLSRNSRMTGCCSCLLDCPVTGTVYWKYPCAHSFQIMKKQHPFRSATCNMTL